MSKNSRTKKAYQQTYRSAWESHPDFKGWLQAVPNNPSRAYCTVCNKTLYAHRLSLLQHMCTDKHTKWATIKFSESEQHKLKGQPSEAKEQMNLDLEASLEAYQISSIKLKSAEDCALQDKTTKQSLPNDSNQLNLSLKMDAVPPISTHVLDSSRGMPVAGLHVSLYQFIDGSWKSLNECVTDPMGRSNEFILREELKPGRFKLHFDVGRYFALRRQEYFYPIVEIVFDVRSPLEHYHVPLVLSPFGYSTYRGS